MKRLYLFLVALAAFVSVVAANSTVVIDGITYQQLNDTEAELINGEQYSSAELVIPAQVQIGGKQLNVVSIGQKAFYGNSVKRVEMPNTVKSIGNQAFCFCENLRQITFSNSLKQIGKNAFYYCHDILELELPATLTSVGEGAFYYCHKVDSLFIPRNLVNIGVAAFARCGSQSIVVAPENTKYDSRGNCNAIIETATGLLMSGCSNTEIPDGVKTIDELAFLMANFQSIVLPNSLTEIRKNAFQACVQLNEIDLPDGLVNLGDSAFYHCDHLSKIMMGNSLKTIGNSTFAECGSINELTLSNSLQTIGDNAF
ncbi:MAG: leucine-rich repeat domain-containing protein, partial [Muribaculaceae bacterium]|nr:leucine-rich repeat domain-containing protein [Muribaculaceae bacterium]